MKSIDDLRKEDPKRSVFDCILLQNRYDMNLLKDVMVLPLKERKATFREKHSERLDGQW